MLVEQHTTDIDLTPVLVFVAPYACRSEVFQCKTKGINLVVATGAVLALAVSRQALANGQLFIFPAGSFGQLAPVTILGLLGWLSEVGRLFLVAEALNLGLGVPLIIFITLANSLLTLVPTPGGIGAVESGVAGLLVRLSSLSVNAATALVLVDRSITYVSVIAVGALLFILRQAIPRWPHPIRSDIEGVETGRSSQEPGLER